MRGDGVGKGREKGTGTAHHYTHLSQEIRTVKPHLAFVTSGNEGKSFSAPKRGGVAQSCVLVAKIHKLSIDISLEYLFF